MKEKEMSKKSIGFITYLRALGVVFILLCHYTQVSGNRYLEMSAQFFDIGNDIFFIISGFCFGIQKNIDSISKWYKKRVKRIFIPYELMIVVLFVVHVIVYGRIERKKWLLQIFGLQGWNGVEGATHTWFITSLLLCYLLTPLIVGITRECSENDAIKKLILFYAIAPIIIIYCSNGLGIESTLITPIFLYAIAFVIGYYFEKNRRKKGGVIVSVVVMCLSFGIRMLGRSIWDGTILYDRLIAGYTHAIGAFCIFYLFAYIFREREEIRTVKFLDKYSFEIYLWHYMFTAGPVRLFGLTPCWVGDCVLVSIVTLVVAVTMNKIVELILILPQIS